MRQFLILTHLTNIGKALRTLPPSKTVDFKFELNSGNHSFTFYSGNEKYLILSATSGSETQAIKMANIISSEHVNCKLVYNGNDGTFRNHKSKWTKSNFVFDIGDELKYTAYINLAESSIIDTPIDIQ